MVNRLTDCYNTRCFNLITSCNTRSGNETDLLIASHGGPIRSDFEVTVNE